MKKADVNIDLDDLITPSDAAELRGVARSTISELIRRKRLTTFEVGGRRFVSRRAVKNFVPLPAGRPPKVAPGKAQSRPRL